MCTYAHEKDSRTSSLHPYEQYMGSRAATVVVVKEAIPRERLGQSEEMANVVLFLAANLAPFVTGAAFAADLG